jgi:plastocyanin/mono/diheme cytochrome c family protein
MRQRSGRRHVDEERTSVGAVQKLATVVIVGLVALATVLVVYLADEPNRRGSETTEQEATSIERGTELFITYCLQCHGPAGLGSMGGENPARIGAPLNQSHFSDEQLANARVIFQSDDPVKQSMAEDWIRYRVTYGVPPEPTTTTKVMPAFGQDLNVEELNDIVYLIMHGDWNYVYNTVVTETGKTVAEATCEEDPSADVCSDLENAPPAYPTAPAPAGSGGSDEQAATPEASADGGLTIEARDIAFSTDQLTVKPGDTITMTNAGSLEHDFTVDDLGIHEVTPGNGDTVTITIPEDAKPGDYEFYCSVPGHKQAGMVGTLTVEG